MRPARLAVFATVLALCALSSATVLAVAVIGPQRVANRVLGGAVRLAARAAGAHVTGPALAFVGAGHVAPLPRLLPGPYVLPALAPPAPAVAFVASGDGRMLCRVTSTGYSYTTDDRGDESGFSWAVVSGEGEVSMSGWSGWPSRGYDRARRERAFWFREDGATWRVDDPALVAEAVRALDETRRIGEEQGRLGAQQGRLGAEQGRLGGRMGALGGRQAAVAMRPRDDEAAQRAQREIERAMEELSARMEALSERQRGLGARQSALGERQREAGRKAGQVLRELAGRARRAGRAVRIDSDV